MLKMDQLNEKSNSPFTKSQTGGGFSERPKSSKRDSDLLSNKNKSVMNNILTQSKSFTNKDNGGINNSQIKSTAINNELKAFERLKKKQEMELLGMVQNELRAELTRKENEEKMRKQKEKEEKFRQELLALRKEEEEKKRLKEKEKEDYSKREEEERKLRDNQRYVEEQKKLKEEQEKEKLRLKEQRLIQEEEKRKQEEYKKHIEGMLEENKRRGEIRQKELEEKERARKEMLERKKMHMMIINAEKSQKKKIKIESNLKNLDERITQQKNEFMEKQLHNDMKKQQFEKLREIAFMDKQVQARCRAEEIRKVIEKNENMGKMKVQNYNEKQKIIQMKKEELEEMQKLELMNKQERLRMRESKIKQTLQMNEELELNKKSVILQKMEYKDSKRKEGSMMREREFMERSEMNTRRRLEKEEIIRRIARMQEEERARTLMRLNEKSQRLDEFKSQKSMIADKKREVQDEISRKKQEYIERFDKIFKKKTLNEKTIGELIKMFPDNDEVIGMINSLKAGSEQSVVSSGSNFHKNKSSKPPTRDGNTKKLKNHSVITTMRNTDDFPNKNKNSSSENLAPILNSSSYNKNFSNTTNLQNPKLLNKTNSSGQFSEKEILRKVEEFRMKLNQGLLKLLSEERQKEDERERVLAMNNNSEERRKLERYFGYERAQASNKIVEYNEYDVFIYFLGILKRKLKSTIKAFEE
jgi:hypothetical protein